MPRTPKEIPADLRRDMRALLRRQPHPSISINRVMDIYRDAAGLSHRDLEYLSRQLGDPTLAIGHSTWQIITTGRSGVVRAPSNEALIAFVYLLGLELDDLDLDPTVQRVVAAGVSLLRKGRVAA